MVGCESKVQSLYQDIYVCRHLIQDRSAWFLGQMIHFFRIQIADSFQVYCIFSSQHLCSKRFLKAYSNSKARMTEKER